MKLSTWGLAALLTVAYTLSFVDRQVLNLLLESVRIDLHVNDTQVSLLVGAAFAIFYVTAGLPLAGLADRSSRRNIIAASVAVWTTMTAACGFAGSFWGLFAARVGVGIGEAGLGPATLSLIGDTYPPERRAIVIGILGSGVSIGMAIALFGGGALLSVAGIIGHALAPFVGPLRPWQVVFLVVATPGLVVAPLCMLIKEPPRGVHSVSRDQPGLLRFLKDRAAVYTLLFLGFSTVAILGYGYGAWLPTLFIRVHGWSASQIGLRYGLMLLLIGPPSSILGGWICDRLMKAGHREGPWWIVAISLPCMGVFYGLAATIPDSSWALVALVPAMIAGGAPGPAMVSALLEITPPEFRARVFAINGLVQTILGLAVGPTAIGAMTDYVFRSPKLIGHSMGTLAVVVGALGTISILAARKRYSRLAALGASGRPQADLFSERSPIGAGN